MTYSPAPRAPDNPPFASPRDRLGLTLIELLVVMLIISVVAAIAFTQMLQANVRSKVSRVRAEHRVLAEGMEAYYVDHGVYPANIMGFFALSTPLAYVHDALVADPFNASGKNRPYFMMNLTEADLNANYILEGAFPSDKQLQDRFRALHYLIASRGPDTIFELDAVDGDPSDPFQQSDFFLFFQSLEEGARIYDPSNGTVSPGDIYRTAGGEITGGPIFGD